MMPAVLLVISFLLVIWQMAGAEGQEVRLQRLEEGLQSNQQLMSLLRLDPVQPLPQPSATWLASLRGGLEEMRLLAEAELAIRPQYRMLASALETALPGLGQAGAERSTAPATGPALQRLQQVATVALRDLRQALGQEILLVHRELRQSWNFIGLLALGLLVLGAVLQGLRLYGLRREALRHATEATRARAQIYAVYNTAPIGLALLDLRLAILRANPCFATMARVADTALAGRALAEVVPALAAPLLPLLHQVYQTGQPLPGQDIVICATRGMMPRHYFVSAELVPEAAGPPLLSLVVVDVTDRVAAETWRGEAVAELNHRVKNTLATVQSLAAQTLRGAGHDPQRFAADFSARLSALSRSHELIAAGGWNNTTLEQAVNAALSPWLPSGRLAVMGPAGLPLRAAQVQALVIALTELAGNAARHGALSGGGGRVTLSWDLLADGKVRLLWQERGGPRLQASPPRRGFGLRFLERGLRHDLGADAWSALRFEPLGLSYEISFPPHGVQVEANPSAISAA